MFSLPLYGAKKKLVIKSDKKQKATISLNGVIIEITGSTLFTLVYTCLLFTVLFTLVWCNICLTLVADYYLLNSSCYVVVNLLTRGEKVHFYTELL